MFTISALHTDRWRKAKWEEFVRDTVVVVRREAPHYLDGLDDAAAFDCIAAGVRQAESLGLRTQRHARGFAALQTVAGEAFMEDPRFATVQRVLANRVVDPDTRLRRAQEVLQSMSAAA